MSQRARALVVAILIALPALYILVNQWTRSGRDVKATSMVSSGAQGVAQSDNADRLTSLEQRVQADPSPANRINLSQGYINSGRYGQAAEVLTSLLQEMPQNAVAWNNLCVARTLQQEFNAALEACNKGIQADATFQLVRNNLKWAQDERQKVVLALAAQERTEPARRDGDFYLAEGLNYLHLGAYGDAEIAWRRTLQLDPRSALAWNNMGTAEMMQHHYPSAMQDFQKAQELDPKSALVQGNLAWAQRSLQGQR